MRKPLDLLEKWNVLTHWGQVRPRLTGAQLLVLWRLLDRQNKRTGQCNPSISRIAEETDLSTRAVSYAIKELKSRGAIERRALGHLKGNVLIFSTKELGLSNLPSQPLPHATAGRPARACQKFLQQASGKTIKETINGNYLESIASKALDKTPMDQGEFERRVLKCFEKDDLGYEGMMSIPVELFESTYSKFIREEVTFNRAVAILKATAQQGDD